MWKRHSWRLFSPQSLSAHFHFYSLRAMESASACQASPLPRQHRTQLASATTAPQRGNSDLVGIFKRTLLPKLNAFGIQRPENGKSRKRRNDCDAELKKKTNKKQKNWPD